MQQKKLRGQFFANKIVVHQYTDIQNIPFVPDREQKECVFNEKKLNMREDKI